VKLKQYIKLNHKGKQVNLANHLGVSKQDVNRWVMRGDVVEDDVLYSKRRELK